MSSARLSFATFFANFAAFSVLCAVLLVAHPALAAEAAPLAAPPAQQDASARELRVLKPDDMTTMEFVGERLNIEVDEKGVVSGLRCG